MENNFLVIGITGNYGVGKSTVSMIVQNEGFPVVNTDELAKELYETDEKLKREIINLVGEEAYSPEGRLNTNLIAKLVFSNDSKSEELLQKINSIVHPKVLEKLDEKIEELGRKHKLVFVESALIYETGIEAGFDYVILVDCPLDVVAERLADKAISRVEVLRRWEKQIPPQQKRELADFTIVNNGNISELIKNTKFVLELIKQLLNP